MNLVIGLIKESGAIKKSMQLADLYVLKVLKGKNRLEELPKTPTRKALGELAEFMKTRRL